ncbi:hypothetical protein NDU88_000410 [Pleurodeles waltl]|uniref:Uncharacterized protein n=1 Tax=Pleurodeles waltl TaxID=8319 RepID=A0AAV7VY23_PLEWA|nr:hypothetical protein NDU88_000410 [Pleurodeles waltl]
MTVPDIRISEALDESMPSYESIRVNDERELSMSSPLQLISVPGKRSSTVMDDSVPGKRSSTVMDDSLPLYDELSAVESDEEPDETYIQRRRSEVSGIFVFYTSCG